MTLERRRSSRPNAGACRTPRWLAGCFVAALSLACGPVVEYASAPPASPGPPEGQARQALTASEPEGLAPLEVIARITGEGATVVPVDNPPGDTHTADLVEGGVRYPIVEQASLPNERHAPLDELIVRDPDGCPPGSAACLRFVGYEWPVIEGVSDGNDRLEVGISTADAADALRLGEWRYLRFQLRIDPETAPIRPSTDTLVAQVWQANGRMARRRGPPLRVSLERASEAGFVDLSFRYSNETTPTSVEFHRETIEKGRWVTFHLAMRPVPAIQGSEPGAVLVWRDQELAFDFDPAVSPRNERSRFHWGYSPRNVRPSGRCADATSPCVKPTFTIRVGMYRSQAADEPGLTRTSFRVGAVELSAPATR